MMMSIYPLLWMVGTAFTPAQDISMLRIVPRHPTSENILKVLTAYPFGTYFLNSLLVSGGSTAAAVVLGTLGGFALARMRAPGTEVIFIILLFTIMVPVQVKLVPLFMLIHQLGLNNSLISLAIPHVASPISIFLSRQYFKTIPAELDDAAIIDGCSWFRIYWSIVMPLSKPMISALVIVKFMGAWNDFLWPLMMAKRPSMTTLQVGMALIREQFSINWGVAMAGATIASLPVLLVFVIFQRYFVSGFAMSGLKS